MQKIENALIIQESEKLLKIIKEILGKLHVNFKIREVDLSYESIWYEAMISTISESRVFKMTLYFYRDTLCIFCNDYQIYIYKTEEPITDFDEWLDYLSKILTAIFDSELRIRVRFSLFSGKVGAIFIKFPLGGVWLGEKKACNGKGKELIFKNWF